MVYDLIIIGAGPAGLTASIYASRYRLSNLVVGKILGGMITLAHKVENFPGFLGTGIELGQKMVEQAKKLGGEILGEEVRGIEIVKNGVKDGNFFKVTTETNKEFGGRAVIVASGTERRKLGVPGEKEYLGKGVSYCTTCDVPFFKDKVVALIGGSNAAVGGAVQAAEYAKKVYIIYRKDKLRADPAWVEEAIRNPKIEIIYNTNITQILGVEEIGGMGEIKEGVVGGVKLDREYKGNKDLALDGVFIEIGGIPASSFLLPLGVKLEEGDYIKVNEKMETNIPGLFAAGDVTIHGLVMSQAIVACADGAIAAESAYKYLKNQKPLKSQK